MVGRKIHLIKIRNSFPDENGYLVKKGSIFQAKIRCFHQGESEMANVIMISQYVEGGFNLLPCPQLKSELSCDNFIFLDEIANETKL